MLLSQYQIKQKLNSNKTKWNSYYKLYQKDTNIPGIKYPNEHLTRFISIEAKKYEKNKKRKILELGFGNITNMSMMQSYGFNVLGLETSEEAVKRARRAIESMNLEKKLEVGLFEGNKLPVKDDTFDIITGMECIYYNLDQGFFAKECHRVLKPGGKIYFSLFSPRHGYMNYIYGKPGAVVKISENHPNSRLIGLELFLFKSTKQLKDIYGKYFDVEIGLEEYDTYPLFMSYYYLFGIKKNSKKNILNFLSKPTTNNLFNNNKKLKLKIEDIEENNIKLLKNLYKQLNEDNFNSEQKYPYEHFVRFLATKNRGELDKFYKNVGREEEFKGKNGKVLELMPKNIANLLMISEMNYIAYGLSFSEIAVRKLKLEVIEIGKRRKILIDKIEKPSFSYKNNQFDFVISKDIGSYMLNQNQLVKETARVLKDYGETFIGYLSPRHGYMKWAKVLDRSYYKITNVCPNRALRGMIIFVADKKTLSSIWSKFFEFVEIKTIEFDFFSPFSSLYFVKARGRKYEN